MLEYTDRVNYLSFLEAMVEEEIKLTDYINECIILSNPNKKKVFTELTALNEVKAGDRIKKFFARLKSFFAKIWQKFLEKLNNWSMENKEYLEKYKDIIIGKKITLASVKMKDHFQGYDRINKVFNQVTNVTLPLTKEQFENISKTAETMTTSNDEASNNTYTDYQIEQYTLVLSKILGTDIKVTTSEDLDSISGTLTNYFNGGEDEETYTTNDIQTNIEKMFKFVYSYKEYYDGLKKIEENYMAAMTKTENAYNKQLETLMQLVKDVYSGGPDEDKAKDKYRNAADQGKKGNVSNGNTELSQAAKDAEKIVNASYTYSNAYNSITETEVVQGSDNKSDSSTVGPDTDKVKTDQSQETAKRISKDASAKAATVKSNNAEDATDATKMATNNIEKIQINNAISKEQLDTYKNKSADLIRAYSTVRTVLFGAMLNALTSTRNDYMIVIRAHVQSYLGQINNPDQDRPNTTV